MTHPAAKDDLLQLAKLCRDSADEQNESIRVLGWEMTKLAFWVAVLQRTHPDQDLMARAAFAVGQANDIPDRVEAKDALFGRLSRDLLR